MFTAVLALRPTQGSLLLRFLPLLEDAWKCAGQGPPEESFLQPQGPLNITSVSMPGDRLLQVHGMSLCSIAHKQAMLCLKGSRQVSAPSPVTGELPFLSELSWTTLDTAIALEWEGGRQETK